MRADRLSPVTCGVLMCVVTVFVLVRDPQPLMAAAREDHYETARGELDHARRTETLGAAAQRLATSPQVQADRALRSFVSGYAALLHYDRVTAERELTRSFQLSASIHAALALTDNAYEVGQPAAVLRWTGLGLADGRIADHPRLEIELRLHRAQAWQWLQKSAEERAEVTAALALARRLGDRRMLGPALAAQAAIVGHAGDKATALALFTEAIGLSEDVDDGAAVARQLLQMSGHLYPLHPFSAQVSTLDRALRMARQGRDRLLEGRVLGRRGAALYSLGRYGDGRRDLIAADAIFREVGALRSRAAAAGNLSMLFTDLGDYQRAEQQARLATALYRRVGNPFGVRQSLDDLGRIALRRGHSALALARHRQVVALTREMGDTVYLAGALVRLGLSHAARGEFAAAERAIRESMTIQIAGAGADDLAAARVALGDVLRLTGRLGEAEREYTGALALAAHAASASSVLGRAHHGLALITSRSGRTREALGHFRTALAEIERARSAADDAALRLAYFSDKSALYVDAIAAVLAEYEDSRDDQLLHEALMFAERGKARLLLDAAGERRDAQGAPVPIDRIAANLQPTDLLIEFVNGTDRSFVFTLRRTGAITAHPLPRRAVLDDLIRGFRARVTQRPAADGDDDQMRRDGARLYEVLLRQSLASAHNVKRLIIVADGLLFYAPFEAFTVSDTTRYLSEQYEVVRAASGSILHSVGQRRQTSAPGLRFVGFADPSVAGAKVNVDGAVRALERDGFSFAPLPGSRREVEAAAAAFGSADTRLYTGAQFTAAAVLEELQRPNQVVHLATHAILDERVPGRSGIVVSNQNAPDAPEILRASNLAELTIPVDLVTLSACQTGLGQVVAGEGVLGLSWALSRAGAASLVVTLWEVSDAASAEMMAAFYRSLAEGQPKAAALTAARKQLARGANATLRHPYFWAGFALIGDSD